LLVADAGMISVPAAAKVDRPQAARKTPAAINKVASGSEEKYTIAAQAKLRCMA
jgi:hypothetical protein